jgi:hypothetical protein
MQGEQLRIRDELSNLGVAVEERKTDDDTYKATFANRRFESIDEHLSLLATHGHVTELDLSNCDALMAADVSRLISLQTLDLSRCVLLPSLDVSGLNSLRTVDRMYCTQLTMLNAVETPSLKLIDLTNARALNDVAALQACEQLVALSLAGCTEVKDLSPLSSLKHLRLLHVDGLDDQVIATGPPPSDTLVIDVDITDFMEIGDRRVKRTHFGVEIGPTL